MTIANDSLKVALEVRHLKLLTAIAEAGRVTAAAHTLGVTQSALSQQLRQAEQRLGTALFHRVNRKMVLTPAGKAMLGTAERVLRDLKNTEQQLRSNAAGEGCVFRISTECYSCYFWLPSVFRRLRQIFPGVQILVDAASTPNPIPPLLKGELDIGIVSSQPTEKSLRLDDLFDDEVVVVLWPGHKLEKRKFLVAEDLEGQHVFVYPPQQDSFLLHKILYPAGVHPASVTELPLTETILEMVRAQMGIAFLAHWAVAPYLREKKLIAKPVTHGGFHRTWQAATLESKVRHPALEQLIALLKKIKNPSA